MKLILVRHGTATLESIDPKKPLSERGRNEIEKIAHFLKQAGIRADSVWHSDKKRAIETAGMLAESVGNKRHREQIEGIGPNDPIEGLLKRIRKTSKSQPRQSIIIVGHLPFIAKLASALMTGSAYDLALFPTGSAMGLEQVDERLWQLEWMIHPALLPSG